MRTVFLILSMCLLAAAATLDDTEREDDFLASQIFNYVQQRRMEDSLPEIMSEYDNVAVGTIIGIETLDEDFLPVWVHEKNSYIISRCKAAEQWLVDRTFYKVKIDCAIRGSAFKQEEECLFDIPTVFKEISYYSEEEPVFTGESFVAVDSNVEQPQVGDTVLLARHTGVETVLCGKTLSAVFWGDKRIEFGTLSVSSKNIENVDKYSVPEDAPINHIPPIAKGESLLKAAFIDPMRKRQNMSDEEIYAASEFFVKGTVVSVEPAPYKLDITAMGLESLVLESWDFESLWAVVDVSEVLKADTNLEERALDESARVWIRLCRTFKQLYGDENIQLSGVIPEVGDEITVWWTESNSGVENDFHAETAEGVCDVWSGVAIAHPDLPPEL